jgi:hypothetical protein
MESNNFFCKSFEKEGDVYVAMIEEKGNEGSPFRLVIVNAKDEGSARADVHNFLASKEAEKNN